ncbi:hypothetical protein I4F81_000017 [Pyropia yezoensis]|uniref:Uncharacterized protein n=1 Tax=Pyropia yezoensis TaxID=2788 RepID=A0ACC3BID9_PYRYE|nr:hypothetical protein I4F81_000017 [Neopyropia yezoensis]
MLRNLSGVGTSCMSPPSRRPFPGVVILLSFSSGSRSVRKFPTGSCGLSSRMAFVLNAAILPWTQEPTLGLRICGRRERRASLVGHGSCHGVVRAPLRIPVSCRARSRSGQPGGDNPKPGLTEKLDVIKEEVRTTTNALEMASTERRQVVQRMSDIRRKLEQPGLSASDMADLRADLEDTRVDRASIDDDKKWLTKRLTLLYEELARLNTASKDNASPLAKLPITGPSPLHAEPVTEVARRLRHFIAPNPQFGTGLFERRFGVNPVPAAVRELHAFRMDARGTGYVMGSPGRGKTLLLLLLLLSIVKEPDLVMSLTRAMRDWWQSLPVYVLSFNGITKVTADDHVLAWIDKRLPLLVRIIFVESWDPTSTSNTFGMYRDHVLKLLTEGRVSVAEVEVVATNLVQARLLPSTDAESTSLTGEKNAAGASAAAVADALRRDRAKPITSVEENHTSLPEDPVMVTAEARRLLPVGTVARHLALLTLGHPRAAIVLDGAVEASSDGDHFFSILVDALAPSGLSVAQKSVNILAQHPLVMAVGLLNYDAPSSGTLTEELS